MKQETENRKCIVCGEVKEKELLLRFTLAPDNQVVPDFKKKLPGKGIYVSVSKTALQKAVEKNLFAKAVKKNAKVSAELVQTVENILRKKGLESICLAKKAGDLVTGFEKVGEKSDTARRPFCLKLRTPAPTDIRKLRLWPTVWKFSLYTVLRSWIRH